MGQPPIRNTFKSKNTYENILTGINKEVTTKDFRDTDTLKGTRHEVPVRYLLEDIHTEPFSEFHHAFLVAGRTEVPPFARKGQKVFMAAVFAFHTGKAVVEIAVIQIPINNLLKIRPPESVLPREMFIIDMDKGFKIILYTAVIIRILRAAGSVNGCGQWHVFLT
jgi:hypothetical protein